MKLLEKLVQLFRPSSSEPEIPKEILENPAPLGSRCETLARWYLETQAGMTCLAQNALTRVGAMKRAEGELDLVMQMGEKIVFVEVRSRRREWAKFGAPSQSIGLRKREKVCHAAKAWLLQNEKTCDTPYRFDIVSVIWPDGEMPELRHIPSVFTWDKLNPSHR